MAKDLTPEEIRQECLAIQSEWTPQERWKRMRSDWRATYRRADGEHIEFDAETYSQHIEGQMPLEHEDDDWTIPPD